MKHKLLFPATQRVVLPKHRRRSNYLKTKRSALTNLNPWTTDLCSTSQMSFARCNPLTLLYSEHQCPPWIITGSHHSLRPTWRETVVCPMLVILSTIWPGVVMHQTAAVTFGNRDLEQLWPLTLNISKSLTRVLIVASSTKDKWMHTTAAVDLSYPHPCIWDALAESPQGKLPLCNRISQTSSTTAVVVLKLIPTQSPRILTLSSRCSMLTRKFARTKPSCKNR